MNALIVAGSWPRDHSHCDLENQLTLTMAEENKAESDEKIIRLAGQSLSFPAHGSQLKTAELTEENKDDMAIIGQQSLKQFEMAQHMQKLLDEIDKNSQWSAIVLASRAYCEEAKNKPLLTIIKGIVSLGILSAVYPAIIGSWACLNSNRVYAVSEIGSADFDTASSAVQGLSNMGMAVTYLEQLKHFVALPMAALLFRRPYHQKICEKIIAAYNQMLLEKRALLSHEEVAFLIERENMALSRWGGLAVGMIAIESIQQQIDQAKHDKLSIRNLVCLIGSQIGNDMRKSSCGEIITKIVKSALLISGVVAAQYPLAIGTYGSYASFMVQDATDLASANATTMANATSTHSNDGHGLEYIAVALCLNVAALKSLLGNQYKALMLKGIEEAYKPYLEDKSLPQEASDLLYRRRRQELAPYQP